jgi:hypothetical protein
LKKGVVLIIPQTARLNLEKKIIETEKTATEAEAFLEQLKNQPANPYGSVSHLSSTFIIICICNYSLISQDMVAGKRACRGSEIPSKEKEIDTKLHQSRAYLVIT